jgi:ribonucleoside-triphosphate reductase
MAKKNTIYVIKKDGSNQKFEPEKIIAAVSKSSKRVGYEFSDDEKQDIIDFVTKRVERSGKSAIPVADMHNYVESALDTINPKVAKSYRDYRNWKSEWAKDFGDLFEKANKILYIGDKENANADSALVSTKRSLILNELGKMLYKRTFLTEEESAAIAEGTIYVHDMSARRDTMNCCLFNVNAVLTGGFEMGNIWYNEPKTLDVCFDVIGDIVLSAASQQYGGFTLPEIDKTLEKYAQKSFDKAVSNYTNRCKMDREEAERLAYEDVQKEMEQGFQGWEYKFNTVASSRGDYPFITITFGLSTSRFGKMASIAALKVRQGGQGKKNHKKPVLFPKLVFLYDENLHGEGKELEDVFEAGVECSSKTMYPDWLSLTGEGYISSMYKQYGKVISPMGCRAFLSPWWEKGGLYKYDETDVPIFVGRFNIGAVSLNLPLIYLKAQNESKDFYEVLDYYLELIRQLHLRTYAYLGEMRASTNPLAYCEGGFLGGHLNPSDKIEPILKSATASFGITALNELQEAYNQKSLAEDGEFALEVLQHINDKIAEFKEEDGRLYAIYGTPAENLCGVQVKQIRSKYGIIPKVSDRPYVSNSFHCHVSEDITPTEKQDTEYRFWEKCNGGKIQYVRYPVDYNLNAIKALIRRAMAMGFYEGVNMSLAYCDDCGHQELEMDVCPCCGSRNLTKIDRMNGYLAYSRVHGDSRLSDHKMAEIADRKSM